MPRQPSSLVRDHLGRKKCRSCEGWKNPAADFARDSSAKDGLQGECKACARVRKRARTEKLRSELRAKVQQEGKVCGHCAKQLPAARFAWKKSTRDGLREICLDCEDVLSQRLKRRVEAKEVRTDDITARYRDHSAWTFGEVPDYDEWMGRESDSETEPLEDFE